MSIALAQISHEKATIASLKRDPVFAANYLRAVLTGGDRLEAQLALLRINEVYESHSASSRDGEYRR